MSTTTLASLVATAISGGSLAVAIVSLIVSYRTAARDAPHLRVTGSIGIPVGPAMSGAEPLLVCLEVANDGRQREIVEDLGFRVGQNKVTLATTYPMLRELPRVLEPGESMTARIPAPELSESWTDYRLGRMDGLYARCASGREYRGKANKSIESLAQTGHLPAHI